MFTFRWILYLWPGLPQCCQGKWLGLILAVAVALILDTAVIATFGWSDAFSWDLCRILWVSFGVAWVAGCVFSLGWGSCRASDRDAHFKKAMDHYLRGEVVEAEQALKARIAADPADVEAHLLLATLFRHAGRVEEAKKQLNWMQSLEGASRWALEIAQEKNLLQKAGRQNDVSPSVKNTSDAEAVVS